MTDVERAVNILRQTATNLESGKYTLVDCELVVDTKEVASQDHLIPEKFPGTRHVHVAFDVPE